MRKNKIVQVVFLYLMLLMCGCTTNTTDNSLMFGENGSPKIVIGDIQASKADIHSVLIAGEKVECFGRWQPYCSRTTKRLPACKVENIYL